MLIILTSLLLINGSVLPQDVDTLKKNNPDVRVKVQKEYDDKGNILRYDSSYSYSWSGDGQLPADLDSILKQFNLRLYTQSGNDPFQFRFNPDPGRTPGYSDYFQFPFNDLEDFFNVNPFFNDSIDRNNPHSIFDDNFFHFYNQYWDSIGDGEIQDPWLNQSVPDNYFDNEELREFLRNQEYFMNQLFEHFQNRNDFLYGFPDDTIPSSKGEIESKKQNNLVTRKNERTINI